VGFVDSPDPSATQRLGEQLGRELHPGAVVGLCGELGSGKTCLAAGIARGLGVDPSVPITSPSFMLLAGYEGRIPLWHADFYRVESYVRLDDAGFEDLLDSRAVLVVEWPERFPLVLPSDRLEVRIELLSESMRRLYVQGTGPDSSDLAQRVLKQWR